MFVQCLKPLTPTCALAGTHPRGLVLLNRDEDDEASFLRQAQSRAVTEHEQGGSFSDEALTHFITWQSGVGLGLLE